MKHKYEMIEEGIKNKDINTLRQAIGSICYSDFDFSSGDFDEAIAYVESKGIPLKEKKLTGPKPVSQIKDYGPFKGEDYSNAVSDLMTNFCDERIADVKAIAKELYGSKKEEVTVPKKIHDHQQPTKKIEDQQEPKAVLKVLLLVIAVIVVLLILKVII